MATVPPIMEAAITVHKYRKAHGASPRASNTIRRGRDYRTDLSALHALCEANYARLMRLFPDYETCNRRDFALGEARVVLEVLERSRYTTILRLRSLPQPAPWLAPLHIELRAYHDAGMLEVGRFQAQRAVGARYPYPNPQMYQEDEKLRQNHFLAAFLEHCLGHGLAPPLALGAARSDA